MMLLSSAADEGIDGSSTEGEGLLPRGRQFVRLSQTFLTFDLKGQFLLFSYLQSD